MSGSIASIPLQGQPVNPIPYAQGWAQTGLIGAQATEAKARAGLAGAQAGQAQAQTGLIGQQATAAAIQNQFALARLNAILPYLTGGVPGAPAGTGAGAAAGGPGDAGAGGVPTIGPGAIGAGAIGAPGAAGASTVQPVGASPLPAVGAGGGAPGGGGAMAAPVPISPYGAMQSPFGVAVPGLLGVQALTATDPTKAWNEVLQARARTIGQAIGGVTNNQEWNDQVRSLYGGGWLSPQDYVALYNHPEHRQSVLNAVQDPNEYAGRLLTAAGMGLQYDQSGNLVGSPTIAAAAAAKAGAVATGTAAGEAPYKQVSLPVRNADGTYSEQVVSGAEAARRLNPPAATGAGTIGAGAGAPPGGSASASPYNSWIARHETAPGGPQANPRSTALGPQQFTSGTWQQTMSAAAPGVMAGKTPEQIAAMRMDPNWSNAMTDAYGDQNAAALGKAAIPGSIAPSGQPYNAAVGLAHAFGAGGAQAILQAPADAPLTQVFPPTQGPSGPVPNPVIERNPAYAGMTVRDIVGRYNDDFGRQPYAPAPAQQQQPGAGGAAGVIGAPKPTPIQQSGIDADYRLAEKDAGYVRDLQDTAALSSATQQNLLYTRDVASALPTGAFGPTKAAIELYFKSLGPEWSQRFLKATTGIDPDQAGAFQEMIKQTLLLAGTAQNKIEGARGSFALTNMFLRGMPGLTTLPTPFRDMMNLFLVQQQYSIDHSQAISTAYDQNFSQFRANPVAAPYTRLNTFDQQYYDPNGIHAPQVYFAAAQAMNGKPYAAWSKGLRPDQISSALGIAGRTDPNVRVFDAQGRPAGLVATGTPSAAGAEAMGAPSAAAQPTQGGR